ncbi:hypothetical protein LLG96_18260 [bacterium]|nr:hypothetical protein [bacterium]
MKKNITPENETPQVSHDTNDMFTITVSENMEIRNILRSGLVEAQGHEPDKIPLFVSWPSWLEDGIVCIYASDLHELLGRAVRDTASSFKGIVDTGDDELSAEKPHVRQFKPKALGGVSETEGKKTDKAREAARTILEKPLGMKTVFPAGEKRGEPAPAETRDETGQGTDGSGQEKSEKTREYSASVMKKLLSGAPASSEQPSRSTRDQELADELFKKMKSGNEQNT